MDTTAERARAHAALTHPLYVAHQKSQEAPKPKHEDQSHRLIDRRQRKPRD